MVQVTVLREFVQGKHRHSACVAEAIKVAEQRCRKGGYRLTPTRRRVLQLVWSNHEPVKAYDVLEQLRDEKKRVAPPTVYRALDFLQAQGFVHKIESLNAYVGCGKPGHQGSGQLLICQVCGEVAELDDTDIIDLIALKARQLDFVINKQTIEVDGLCAKCRVKP